MHFKNIVYYLSFCLGVALLQPCYADETNTTPMQNVFGDEIQPADDTQASQTWSDKTQEILNHALSLSGIRYRYGGRTPETGFDCSGFVSYVFRQAAKISLPPTAYAMSKIGENISKNNLQPGDLIFFNTLKRAYSHVAIYIGNDQFIHSPSTGSSVRIENINNSYWAKRFNGAKRVSPETQEINQP